MTARARASSAKLIYLSIILLLIIQLANFLVVKYFPYSLNQQIVFGLIGSNFIAYFVSLVVLILLIFCYWKKIIRLEFSLLASGLISNLIDRAIYGGVVDYFSLFFIPKFNLADILIVAGALIIVTKIVKSNNKKSE